MSSTNFIDGVTVIAAPWLNDVNKSVYTAIGDGTIVPSTPAEVKVNLALNNVDNTSDINKPISTATQSVFTNLAGPSGSSSIGFLQNGVGAVARTTQSKLRDIVNIKDFGAVGDGTTDDTAAIQAAWAASKNLYFPTGTYYAPGLTLVGSNSLSKRIVGGNSIITGDTIKLRDMRGLTMDNITFSPSVALYIEGARYCNWSNVISTGLTKWGRYSDDLSSWSTYWNEFSECRFAGIEFTLSISSANFNSNTFSTCEFRPGTQSALMTFKETAANDGVFVSNTFVGCDISYAPVFNIVTEYLSFVVTIIGGYMDTGTPMYQVGSFEANTLDVIGLRNPSGSTLSSKVSSDIRMTSGGTRPKRHLPVGVVNLFKTETIPTNIGTFVRTATSVPLPYDGDYTISAVFKQNGTPLVAATFTNTTTSTVVNDILDYGDGYSSYTFHAAKGDVITVSLDGDASTNSDVLLLSLTPGAGVLDAVPYRSAFPTDAVSVVANNAVATTLTSFTAIAYKTQFYRIEVFTKNTVQGGGGEKIILDIGVSTGGSSATITTTQVARTSVNGPGGQSGTLTISVSSIGLVVTVTGTLSGTPTAVNCMTLRAPSGIGAS